MIWAFTVQKPSTITDPAFTEKALHEQLTLSFTTVLSQREVDIILTILRLIGSSLKSRSTYVLAKLRAETIDKFTANFGSALTTTTRLLHTLREIATPRWHAYKTVALEIIHEYFGMM